MPFLKTKICIACEQKYWPTSNNQKYCKNCSIKIRKQYKHNYGRRWRQLYKKEIKNYNQQYYNKNKKQILDYHKKYGKNNPEKINAHNIMNNLIMSGKIQRPNKCSQCNKKCKPEGHHPDYNKPLGIIWLCKQCHIKLHKWETF